MFAPAAPATQPIDCKMIGKYVIVRCRDAGVHAGVLESYSGKECVLTESHACGTGSKQTDKNTCLDWRLQAQTKPARSASHCLAFS